MKTITVMTTVGGAATRYAGYMYPTFSAQPPEKYKGYIHLDSSAEL